MKRICCCLLLWLCLLNSSSYALRDHFCERNVSESHMVPVTKQRTIIKKPSVLAFWKKPKQLTETYTTEEEQIVTKVVSECCPGYAQVESGLCEPICVGGCPAFASCVAPQRCQCTTGYISAQNHHDGSHYCEPICENSCARGAQCVDRNTCACLDGYRALRPTDDGVTGPCVPNCQLGSNCLNGQCLEAGHCECDVGYMWSMDMHMCLLLDDESLRKLEQMMSSPSSPATDSATATATDVVVPAECPPGYVLYGRECRAELFESNDSALKDCRKTGCGPHQTCSEQGTCSCNSGYVATEQQENSTLICQRTLLTAIESLDQAADDEDDINDLTIPIIGVASGFLFTLLIAGLITNYRRRRGLTDGDGDESEPKEPVVQCEFTKKSYDVDEWVP